MFFSYIKKNDFIIIEYNKVKNVNTFLMKNINMKGKNIDKQIYFDTTLRTKSQDRSASGEECE